MPGSVDSTALSLHPAAEKLPVPGVVICVDNSITVKCSDKFPCDKLEQNKLLCEKLRRVPEGLLGFTKAILLSLLNLFYSNCQHTVTS